MPIMKVNVGSGPRILDDWVNYDSSIHLILSKYHLLKKILYAFKLIPKQVFETSWPYKQIKRIDLRKGLPLVDDTVDFLYCSHFLEHLSRGDGFTFLKECHRVIKQAGWIRLVCPDLRIIVGKYLEADINYVLFEDSDKANLSHAFIQSLCLSDNRPLLEKLFFPGSLHRCMYDFDSIAYLLDKSGFNTIKRRSYKEGITPDIDILDNRPEESLYVEAQKL
jgi:hypothetical protein